MTQDAEEYIYKFLVDLFGLHNKNAMHISIA